MGQRYSESVAGAVINACGTIAGRLTKYKSQGTWAKIVAAALADGVDLSAEGEHERTVGAQGYDENIAMFAYVEIDVLTGETQVLSANIYHDCGHSLNPSVDVGQIEGSLIQGLGFCLMEEQTWSTKDNRLVNNGTWEYKIPTGLDIPIQMDVTFPKMENTTPGNVAGSKATGESAYCVAQVFFYAVKDAILAARKDAGKTGYFRLYQPASVKNIQQACLVNLAA